jgi:hypothetical protein
LGTNSVLIGWRKEEGACLNFAPSIVSTQVSQPLDIRGEEIPVTALSLSANISTAVAVCAAAVTIFVRRQQQRYRMLAIASIRLTSLACAGVVAPERAQQAPNAKAKPQHAQVRQRALHRLHIGVDVLRNKAVERATSVARNLS